MDEFVVNQAGAKIYKDVSKHNFLEIPILKSTKDKGMIYRVLSVGLVNQKHVIITIETHGEVLAYRLSNNFKDWVENSMLLAQQDFNPFPADVEFGILDGRYYAEII
ncbi:hypothetical protein [Sporolactobacillus pectinivorans]|uniref:hypothetical protein n=1 Tax=Sporolactobacillus pectinivorans TaxID=1591408 RepID=UPI000C25A386|nr:hypothetical protein [Sporolactobacillus pectinivorans]